MLCFFATLYYNGRCNECFIEKIGGSVHITNSLLGGVLCNTWQVLSTGVSSECGYDLFIAVSALTQGGKKSAWIYSCAWWCKHPGNWTWLEVYCSGQSCMTIHRCIIREQRTAKHYSLSVLVKISPSWWSLKICPKSVLSEWL